MNRNVMKNMKDIPHKFIVTNSIIAFGVLLLTHLTEPANGAIIFLIILFAFLVVALILSIISKLIDKSPLPWRAIRDCLKEYFSFLFIAWGGWVCHETYQRMEGAKYAILYVFSAVAITLIGFVIKNYGKHRENLQKTIS